MKRFYLKPVYIAFLLGVFIPCISVASDNWSEFVLPISAQFKSEDRHSDNKSYKTIWRSGVNFKFNNNHQFDISSRDIIREKKYALTKPQRKSVNPWKVNRSQLKQQYTFGPTMRPWGAVPEKFQKNISFNPVNQMRRMNHNFDPMVSGYQPYRRNALIDDSNLLVSPMRGFQLFSPFYNIPNTNFWR